MSEHQPFPAETLNAAGLNRQFVFDLADLPADIVAKLAPQAGERQLILFGHAGRRLWACVQAAGMAHRAPPRLLGGQDQGRRVVNLIVAGCEGLQYGPNL